MEIWKQISSLYSLTHVCVLKGSNKRIRIRTSEYVCTCTTVHTVKRPAYCIIILQYCLQTRLWYACACVCVGVCVLLTQVINGKIHTKITQTVKTQRCCRVSERGRSPPVQCHPASSDGHRPNTDRHQC